MIKFTENFTDVLTYVKLYDKISALNCRYFFIYREVQVMKNDITKQIQKLKKEKNAVILAHYYAPDEVQRIADHVGDSFYLAKTAQNTNADTVVFCGVGFMGESVKIINPEKTVLVPDIKADCPMAHMAQIKKIEQLKKEYEDLAIVCYINSTAELKCHSDVCVTSSNALKIVNSLPNKNIFFIPDKNLGAFVAKQVQNKNIILNDGYCPIHASLTADNVKKMKAAFPDALVLTHPECENEVVEISDFVGSTAEIISFTKDCDCKEFIVCTEEGVKYALESSNPEKKFHFPEGLPQCADMKTNTLQAVLHVLQTGENEITVEKEKAQRALLPLQRMLQLAK